VNESAERERERERWRERINTTNKRSSETGHTLQGTYIQYGTNNTPNTQEKSTKRDKQATDTYKCLPPVRFPFR